MFQRRCETASSPKNRELILRRTHPTSRFRVNEVLKNSPVFSEAFKCPPKAAMNPAISVNCINCIKVISK
ncbi:unnamed protein product [Caenorhabditis brenneri]